MHDARGKNSPEGLDGEAPVIALISFVSVRPPADKSNSDSRCTIANR